MSWFRDARTASSNRECCERSSKADKTKNNFFAIIGLCLELKLSTTFDQNQTAAR